MRQFIKHGLFCIILQNANFNLIGITKGPLHAADCFQVLTEILIIALFQVEYLQVLSFLGRHLGKDAVADLHAFVSQRELVVIFSGVYRPITTV